MQSVHFAENAEREEAGSEKLKCVHISEPVLVGEKNGKSELGIIFFRVCNLVRGVSAKRVGTKSKSVAFI